MTHSAVIDKVLNCTVPSEGRKECLISSLFLSMETLWILIWQFANNEVSIWAMPWLKTVFKSIDRGNANPITLTSMDQQCVVDSTSATFDTFAVD